MKSILYRLQYKNQKLSESVLTVNNQDTRLAYYGFLMHVQLLILGWLVLCSEKYHFQV